MKDNAFTLLEVLVTLVVLAVVAALAIPAFTAAVNRGRSAACLLNLRSIGAGLQSYLGENNLRMPVLAAGRASREEDVQVLDTLLAPYVDDPGVFHCPADRRLYSQTGNSYIWNSALNGQSAASLNLFAILEDRSRIPVVSDKEGWHRESGVRVNFLYADGHASENIRLFTEQ